jgi:hypothetical protein
LKNLYIILLSSFLLFGCATNSYDKYADSSVAMDKEEVEAYSTKIVALTTIATDSKATEATKAGATMAIALTVKPKRQALVAPKDPLDTGLEFAKVGLQGYLGWLNFFSRTIDATKGAADVDIANRAISAGTVQFGSTK